MASDTESGGTGFGTEACRVTFQAPGKHKMKSFWYRRRQCKNSRSIFKVLNSNQSLIFLCVELNYLKAFFSWTGNLWSDINPG